jgi:hypothetical protein
MSCPVRNSISVQIERGGFLMVSARRAGVLVNSKQALFRAETPAHRACLGLALEHLPRVCADHCYQGVFRLSVKNPSTGSTLVLSRRSDRGERLTR